MAFGFTPHALVYDLYGVGDPQISPDGTRVIWIQSRAKHDRLKPERDRSPTSTITAPAS